MANDEHKHSTERRNRKGGWTTSDKLTAVSIAATFVVSVASLIVSTITKNGAERSAESAEASRVETGNLASNSNEGALGNPWRPWQGPVSTETVYVGIRRLIVFQRPFRSTPRVSVAFSVINVRSAAEVLGDLAYRAPDEHLLARLRELHVVSFVETPTERDFVLEVGVGLPTEPGKRLSSVLLQRPLSTALIDDMREHRQLKGEAPDSDERWMANFYSMVGTFGLSWTAQAKP